LQAAWENNPKDYERWSVFKKKIKADGISAGKLKKMISTLDDERQWAALHYAVEHNNIKLCEKLTSKTKSYRCGTLFFIYQNRPAVSKDRERTILIVPPKPS
jgi:hypothetical protein